MDISYWVWEAWAGKSGSLRLQRCALSLEVLGKGLPVLTGMLQIRNRGKVSAILTLAQSIPLLGRVTTLVGVVWLAEEPAPNALVVLTLTKEIYMRAFTGGPTSSVSCFPSFVKTQSDFPIRAIFHYHSSENTRIASTMCL